MESAGLCPGPVLFNIFSSDMELTARCTLKCADDSSSHAGGQSCQPGVSGQEPPRIKPGQMARKEEPLAGIQPEDRGAALRERGCWRVPREVVPSPSLEVFKAGLCKTLSNPRLTSWPFSEIHYPVFV